MELNLAQLSPSAASILVPLAAIYCSWNIIHALHTAFFAPLAKFPGPTAAALTTYWHAFVECVLNRSFTKVLTDLHQEHGDVVRIGPNELHFANPQAYHDIYNSHNRWDKEKRLYHSFGEDRSSFGFLTYSEAKPRKDVLSKRFSVKAVLEAQRLIQDKVNALCDALRQNAGKAQAVQAGYAFRCMTMDVITYLCFGKSVDAIKEPNFEAPIIQALDASTPVFIRFKHSELYKNMIQGCPPKLAKVLAPETTGLIELQQILGQQIKEISQEPRNLDLLPHNLTIYHVLMSPDARKTGEIISPGSLYEEAQALMFAGADTVGNTLMIISYFLGKDAERQQKLKAELDQAWKETSNQQPPISVLENLPYLNAVIKEGLRYSSGVVAGLLRIVPKEGATIAGKAVPGGTIVSCASPFVHFNKDVFPEPRAFIPERWLKDAELDRWLVSFSKGPRSCLGINLAWMELRLTTSAVYHHFSVVTDPSSPEKIDYKDAFLPSWQGTVRARFTPVA